MAVTLHYFTEFGKLAFQQITVPFFTFAISSADELLFSITAQLHIMRQVIWRT